MSQGRVTKEILQEDETDEMNETSAKGISMWIHSSETGRARCMGRREEEGRGGEKEKEAKGKGRKKEGTVQSLQCFFRTRVSLSVGRSSDLLRVCADRCRFLNPFFPGHTSISLELETRTLLLLLVTLTIPFPE